MTDDERQPPKEILLLADLADELFSLSYPTLVQCVLKWDGLLGLCNSVKSALFFPQSVFLCFFNL